MATFSRFENYGLVVHSGLFSLPHEDVEMMVITIAKNFKNNEQFNFNNILIIIYLLLCFVLFWDVTTGQCCAILFLNSCSFIPFSWLNDNSNFGIFSIKLVLIPSSDAVINFSGFDINSKAPVL